MERSRKPEDESVRQYKNYYNNTLYKVRELENLWQNYVNDIFCDGKIKSAEVRSWADKLIRQYNYEPRSKMIIWLKEMADVMDTYSGVVKKIKERK